MKTYIINVDHRDETGKYWSDSYVKNKPVTLLDSESIHDAIKRVVEDVDSVEFSYKGKPQGNVYRDKKDGTSYVCGYLYRTKHYIENRSDGLMKENVPFTTWVTITGELIPAILEEVNEN